MEFRDAYYSRPDNSAIDMEINHPEFGWQPFTAAPTDPEEHGCQLFSIASEGVVAPYTPPSIESIRGAMAPLTARQLRLGLVTSGFSLSQVSAVIDALPAGADKDKAQIEWEYATTFDRTHPLIATVGGALGLTDVQIDAMWTAAITL
ncbi:hypothetical protein [Ensifer sp. Root423]|uniref:hypothetical protein n=1 Tax=Ensifer sp. Root423 TaxID=1736534 RepID=UPI000AE1A261|nr:hypothetical protein [Ensifer sp. Root423]